MFGDPIRAFVLACTIGSAIAVGFTLYTTIRGAGYAACMADAAKVSRIKNEAATKADDDMRRCLSDPACRLRDDGYLRRD